MSRNGRRVNAKSIMGVMMLAAGLGSEVDSRPRADEQHGGRRHRGVDQRQVRRGEWPAHAYKNYGWRRRPEGLAWRHEHPGHRNACLARRGHRRAVLVASSRVDVAHYFIDESRVESGSRGCAGARRRRRRWPAQARPARRGAGGTLGAAGRAPDAAARRRADRCDQAMDRRAAHNAEWALSAQLEVLAPVRRDGGRVPARAQGRSRAGRRAHAARAGARARGIVRRGPGGACARLRPARIPLVLVANDIAPADMLHFKGGVFTGFVTDVGGAHRTPRSWRAAWTSRPWSGARGEPHHPPGRLGHHRRRQRAGDRHPSPIVLEEYRFRQRQSELERERLSPAAAHAGRDAGRRTHRTAGNIGCRDASARWRPGRSAWACSAASSSS